MIIRPYIKFDELVKTLPMPMQKFRPTRPGGFPGAKAYLGYVEVLKKRRNAVGRNFCDAIKFGAYRLIGSGDPVDSSYQPVIVDRCR